VVPGGTRTRDSGVPGLGGTLSGDAKGGGRFEIRHTDVGKRERRKVKAVGGWEDVLAGKWRSLVKGETRKAERGIYFILSTTVDDASHSGVCPWGVLAAGFQAVRPSFGLFLLVGGRPGCQQATARQTLFGFGDRKSAVRLAMTSSPPFVWPRGQSCYKELEAG
jgi:hypothetical protein